jgi:hypothetical protein
VTTQGTYGLSRVIWTNGFNTDFKSLTAEGVSREPSVASGKGRVSRSLHAGAVRNLGVAMVKRGTVAIQASAEIPAPPPGAGEMGDILGRLDALKSTVATLVGRVVIVEVAMKSHTDMAAAIDGRFSQLLGLI